MRIRLLFAKTEAMRFTGHLDLFRAIERMIRRSRLPLAYSQGFKPHPRINLASALPLGFTSDAEMADIWLQEEIPVELIQRALQDAAPPGILIHSCFPAAPQASSLQADLVACDYLVTLLEPIPNLESKVDAILAASELPRQRRNKSYDLRPLIEQLQVLSPSQAGFARLYMRLAAREGATGRPEEVVAELGGDTLAARYHRLRLVFSSAVTSN
jgi:radical SAM-linked protein